MSRLSIPRQDALAVAALSACFSTSEKMFFAIGRQMKLEDRCFIIALVLGYLKKVRRNFSV